MGELVEPVLQVAVEDEIGGGQAGLELVRPAGPDDGRGDRRMGQHPGHRQGDQVDPGLLGPAAAGFFVTPSTMPGALIEPLFITDPFEGSIAASAAGQHAIAQGVAQAVEQYFAPAAPAPIPSITAAVAAAAGS